MADEAADIKLPPIGERITAHTDKERTNAMAKLRIASAEFIAAKKAVDDAIKRRQAAIVAAVNVGCGGTTIARACGLKSASNAHRMWERHYGADPNAGMKTALKIVRSEGRRMRKAELNAPHT